jgi:hypothetical protein
LSAEVDANLDFPYLSSIKNNEDKDIGFTYLNQMKPGIYKVMLHEDETTAILKFTRNYSIGAHSCCTKSPKILGYQGIATERS